MATMCLFLPRLPQDHIYHTYRHNNVFTLQLQHFRSSISCCRDDSGLPLSFTSCTPDQGPTYI